MLMIGGLALGGYLARDRGPNLEPAPEPLRKGAEPRSVTAKPWLEDVVAVGTVVAEHQRDKECNGEGVLKVDGCGIF